MDKVTNTPGKEAIMANQAYLERSAGETEEGSWQWGWRMGDDYCRAFTTSHKKEEVPEDDLELLAMAAGEAKDKGRQMLECILLSRRGMRINETWYGPERVAPVLRGVFEGVDDPSGQDSMHRRMLAMAEKMLDARASLDSHPPGSYDADEEGYVASILNALHQWCVAHNVDWHEELDWAQRFFEQDMAETGPGPESPPPLGIDRLACPECGHAGHFIVGATVLYLMNADGTVKDLEHPLRWDADSQCACPECDRRGKVGQFRNPGKEN